MSPYLPGMRSRLWRYVGATPGTSPGETIDPGDGEPADAAAAPVLALISRLPLDDDA